MPIERFHLDGALLGDDEVLELLATMRRRARDLRAVFDTFGDYYAAFHFWRFARSGEFLGTKRWRPLDPKYKQRKTAMYGPRPILVATNSLAASLNHRPLDVDIVGPRHAEFGTAVDYAKYHQTGTRFMPKRPLIVPLTDAQLALLDRLIADHILPPEAVRELTGRTGAV